MSSRHCSTGFGMNFSDWWLNQRVMLYSIRCLLRDFPQPAAPTPGFPRGLGEPTKSDSVVCVLGIYSLEFRVPARQEQMKLFRDVILSSQGPRQDTFTLGYFWIILNQAAGCQLSFYIGVRSAPKTQYNHLGLVLLLSAKVYTPFGQDPNAVHPSRVVHGLYYRW